MNNSDYDDIAVLREYFSHYGRMFMTDFEKRCVSIGGRHHKSSSSESEEFRKYGQELFEREADEEMKQALAVGYWAYRDRITERLVQDALEGRQSVNRCPKCHRIARTPKAKQCRWCYFSWRE